MNRDKIIVSMKHFATTDVMFQVFKDELQQDVVNHQQQTQKTRDTN